MLHRNLIAAGGTRRTYPAPGGLCFCHGRACHGQCRQFRSSRQRLSHRTYWASHCRLRGAVSKAASPPPPSTRIMNMAVDKPGVRTSPVQSTVSTRQRAGRPPLSCQHLRSDNFIIHRKNVFSSENYFRRIDVYISEIISFLTPLKVQSQPQSKS